MGGWFAAALTAPHVLGPITARVLDAARSKRLVIATACWVYGVALAAGGTLLEGGRYGVALAAIVIAGLAGPLLTGGLSSVLATLVGAREHTQRRAQSWDALTYGLAGTLGPAAVALLAGLLGPRVAATGLGIAAAAAGCAVLALRPRFAPIDDRDRSQPRPRVLSALIRIAPLQQATILTMAAALGGGALAVLAVHYAQVEAPRTATSAALVAVFGFGNLVGSLVLMAVPLRGSAERQLRWWGVAVGVAFGLCAIAQSPWLLAAAFAIAGAVNAPFFAATLAVRSEFSPPAIRGQAFAAMAGLKIAASSAGAAIAGTTAALGHTLNFGAAGALVLVIICVFAIAGPKSAG